MAGTLLLAAAAGAAAQALHWPLPWVIGPLLVTALGSAAGLPLAASHRLRNAGQWIIGTALGLYFTPAVVAVVAGLAPAIALGVAWALLLGHGFYLFLRCCEPGAGTHSTPGNCCGAGLPSSWPPARSWMWRGRTR